MTRRRKKHRPDEIVAKLRDADAMLNAGKDLAAVLQALEVSDSTLERLRAQSFPLAEHFSVVAVKNSHAVGLKIRGHWHGLALRTHVYSSPSLAVTSADSYPPRTIRSRPDAGAIRRPWRCAG